MYTSSTQKKYWTFSNEQELNTLRTIANKEFIEKHGKKFSEEEKQHHFLTMVEERIICRQYEFIMKDFCSKFQPLMPKNVIATSFAYFKRFYLHNSVMDYHPKEIMVTCVYLACKVEEFNVSITQFVGNLKGDLEKAADIILNNELLLMQQLNYHLTIYNCHRPVEGFLIDIKTRFPVLRNAEKLRPGIEKFMDRSLFTDACLLYSPSQLALTAVLVSASRLGENIDSYITDTLLSNSGRENMIKTIETLKRLKATVKHVESLNRDQVKSIEKKLDRCRNQENNPDSNIYKRKLKEELLAEEDDFNEKKHARLDEDYFNEAEDLLNS